MMSRSATRVSFIFFMFFVFISCETDKNPLGGIKEKDTVGALDYFPLQVGNTWTYDVSSIDPDINGKTLTLSIVGTRTFRGKTYYLFKSDPSYWSPLDSALFRISGQQVLRWVVEKAYLWYDFGTEEGISWIVPMRPDRAIVTLDFKDYWFEVTVPAGSFANCYVFYFDRGPDASWGEFFAPKVGLVYVGFAMFDRREYCLREAKINGTTYP